ncbi:hypothetical protein PSV08DRAFT_229224 [Bipolaris maydis]|uniref:uncharacterized protein n=1 Tax=Cochliobolus heterostrophus TaxID=5016 RepID=UPI0024DC3311|nr:hypothetical protein PSV08DRAFT_208298 [Bipolaris maydis]KAJ6267632.1 hypothetical protein PSV08DRAFT_229224 [Bipolaris maydis]
MLQSWDRNGAYGYWIVTEEDRSVPISSSFDNSLLQQSVPRMQRLEQLHRDELVRSRGQLKGSSIDTSSPDMALNTNWMRRTQWAETFVGADRKLLVQLAQIPCGTGENLEIEIHDGTAISSSKEDELKLRHIVTTLDRVFDRCEDTVRHTDVSIRCLLRSSYPDRTYKAPFELVGRKATTQGYRRLFKKAVCFCVRFWRLGEPVRQNLLRRSLTDAQDQALKQLWHDEIWVRMPEVQGKESQLYPPESEPATPGDLGWLSDDDFDEIASTITDDSVEELDGDDIERAVQAPLECVDSNQKGEGRLLRSRRTKQPAVEDTASIPVDSDNEGNPRAQEDTTKEEWTIVLEHVIFCFVKFLSTEEYEDGKPSSTLLIYASGVLGISHDGSTFERAKSYTSKLSAMIYCVRMIILKATLPRVAHVRLGWTARPRHGQTDLLNEVRKKTLCLGSPAPMNELLSLRDYGRVISRSDGPSFLVTWSEDGQVVSWDNAQLSMAQSRQISHDTLLAASLLCKQLMYGWSPLFDLSCIHDNLACTTAGYSFVTDTANGLAESYLDLSRRASLDTVSGLMTDNDWNRQAVGQYLDQYSAMTELVMLLVYLVGGQASRVTELSALEHCNGPSTSRGICVYSRKMALIFRHGKSRRATNHEFIVVRFLPEEASRLMYYYLVFIRPFACMLYRACLGMDINSTLLFSSPSSPSRPLKTNSLTKILMRQTTLTLGHPLSVKIYRQVSIAITEKHVRQISKPFNQHDDRSTEADINVVFAWQSGHRPLQRGTTYGIDGAFPDSLQPALLRVCEWASNEWHKFLQLQPATDNTRPEITKAQKRALPSSIDQGTPKRPHTTSITQGEMECPLVGDSHVTLMHESRRVGNGPWATGIESAFYNSAPKNLWPGSLPIFGRPSPFERDSVIEERKLISAHVNSGEIDFDHEWNSRRQLQALSEKFQRWKNVGCQLCYVKSGKPEPDHKLECCDRWDDSEKARRIFNWLQGLKLPRFTASSGDCTMCSQTDSICGDIKAMMRMHETEHEEVQRFWRNRLNTSPYGDGECENKPLVKRTIAALCAYDDQILGKFISQRLRDKERVEIMAENHMAYWFERIIDFDGTKIYRLLFVFELLIRAFEYRKSNSLVEKNFYVAEEFPSLCENGWDDEEELQGWRNALDWWVRKCGFCAGRGLDGTQIKHSLRDCKRGGARQRSIRMGEAIFAEGFKAQGGCAGCGVPREFCDQWTKSSDGHWQMRPSQKCQYGRLVYNTVVGLFQCSDNIYALDLYTTIEEEGDEEYREMHDEDVTMWLCRKLVVSGIECAEITRQLWVWTRMVQKAQISLRN